MSNIDDEESGRQVQEYRVTYSLKAGSFSTAPQRRHIQQQRSHLRRYAV